MRSQIVRGIIFSIAASMLVIFVMAMSTSVFDLDGHRYRIRTVYRYEILNGIRQDEYGITEAKLSELPGDIAQAYETAVFDGYKMSQEHEKNESFIKWLALWSAVCFFLAVLAGVRMQKSQPVA